MKKKNDRRQRVIRLGDVEYVPAPDLEGVPKLKVPGPDDDRLAAVRDRLSRPRPAVTFWVDELGSLVVQDNTQGTKTITRHCPECLRWFKVVRVAEGRARWPETCSDPCKASNRRKVDAERQRRKRRRDKMPQAFSFETLDCDLHYQSLEKYLNAKWVVEQDGVVYRQLSPEARAAAEAYLREQEEWESWAYD